MIVLGLTGSIGMGKTVAARTFESLGVPVHDSDAAVHALMKKGGRAVEAVGKAFPGVVKDGAVDRPALGKIVFGDPAELKRLEAILHPMVRDEEQRFRARMKRRREPLVVLDVPLLLETGGDARCDAVAVVSAPARVQRSRVLARPGMTPERLDAVLKHQMSDKEKKKRADFVIHSGIGRTHSLRQIRRIVTMLLEDGPPQRHAVRGRRRS